jgi:hypothetical protein
VGKGALAPCPPPSVSHFDGVLVGKAQGTRLCPPYEAKHWFHYRPPLCSANDISQHFMKTELAEQ